MQHDNNFVNLVNDAKTRIKEVSTDETYAALKNNEDFVLIDVREDSECANGVLPKAIHIAKGVLERDIAARVPAQDTKIILYCGGGFRSALAADALQNMGYSNVFSMAGGYRTWHQMGLPIEGELV